MKIDSFSYLLVSAMVVQFSLVGCGSNESYLDEAPVDPKPVENRYGANGELIQEPGDQAPAQGGRFGFSGNDAGGVTYGGTNKREVREMADGASDAAGNLANGAVEKTENVKKKASSSIPNPAEYKFANKVSGDPLYVTLPGKGASHGKISIEKYDSAGKPTGQPLPKGTPVAIPDPANPGKKIYFKVP